MGSLVNQSWSNPWTRLVSMPVEVLLRLTCGCEVNTNVHLQYNACAHTGQIVLGKIMPLLPKGITVGFN